jgi:hypothetical protein
MNGKPDRKCVVRLSHKIIKLSGVRTSVFYLTNPQIRTVERKELDGCLHPEGGICDWLVETADAATPKVQVFVELKGHHWEQATKQLQNALNNYPPNRGGFLTRCYIVGTGFPAFVPRGQRLIDLFQKRYGVRLFTKKDGQSVELEA